jgi:outer membrane immunogenic protein
MNKKLLLASSILVFAGPALAADLPARMPTKAPIVAPVAYNWTGCHLGAHVGAGWSRTSYSETPPSPYNPAVVPAGTSLGFDSDASVLGGVQAGCDYQFAGNWVIGLGGDFSWTDIKHSGIDPFFDGKNGSQVRVNGRTDQLATLTGRLGYSWDRVLLYAKGGGAWARDEYNIQNLVFMYGGPCGSTTQILDFFACNPAGGASRFGWTVGVGAEWAFADNWSMFAEYNHYGFGNKGVSFTDPNNTNNPLLVLDVKQDIDAVKLGINYRFRAPGPVVARY